MESGRLDRGQRVRYRDAEGSVSQINGDTYDIYLDGGRVQAARDQLEPIYQRFAFADFEGVVDNLGGKDQMAVYRVTLPSGRLNADKWAGRPPPPAPEALYTGPRSDGLLSTGEISGEYSAPCDDCKICNSMTVVPLGPDAIETWISGCLFLPLFFIGPVAYGEVRTRNPGTNDFDWMTFSADGTAKTGEQVYKKRSRSQKRTFQKVETRDLAGKWRGYLCIPFVPLSPLTSLFCTTKKALNQDQYEESGLCCWLCLPLPYLCGGTRTRRYVNGHPTNNFDGTFYRDSGYTSTAGHDGCGMTGKKCG